MSTQTKPYRLPAQATAETAVLDEINRLMAELQERRSGPRPAPESLVKAYHAAIEREYQRLDQLTAERTRDPAQDRARGPVRNQSILVP